MDADEVSRMRLIKTWTEDGRTFVFAYKQEDYQIFDFKVAEIGILQEQ